MTVPLPAASGRPAPAVLPTPVLDDRDFDQLLAELRDRIPVYAPEWTDLGPSDPGITLLELVAHLGETLLFRFNQIPDQTRLWLLRLLQVPPYPPRRATGLVAFTADRPVGAPPGVALGTTVMAGDLPFRVGNDVTVLPVQVTAAVKTIVDAPTDPILRDEFERVLDANGLDEATARPYEERVLRRDPTGNGEELLDVAAAADRCLWIAVHAAEGAPGTVDEQRRALLDPTGPLTRVPIVLGIGSDAQRPTIDDIEACDRPLGTAGVDTPLVPGAERPGGTADRVDSSLVWQVSAQDGSYLALGVVRDTSDGLRRSGVVAVQLPSTRLAAIGVVDTDDDPDRAGVGELPPALTDGLPVLFWVRAFPRQGVPEIGALRWVGVNAADVEQVAQAPVEVLGRGEGLSQQELALAGTPVVPGSLRVEVQENGVDWEPWEIVESLAASGPGDRHLLLDPAAGRVRCGDSVRGRVLPAGAAVRAVAYRHGGGRAGNVAARAINRVVDGGVQVANPLPTAGGEDTETITRALERIPGELSRHDRAVVADDFRELATVPGVGRAECLPRFEPTSRRTDAAGAVTVIVWPTEDPQSPDAPSADATLLRAVCERLDARRLVTTELYVVPPTYRPVAVSVGLAVKRGYSEIGVRRWVELVLRQYLSPLPPFGPDGRGWPLGHRVHGPELEAAVLQVEGVEFIEELLVAEVRPGQAPRPGTVVLAGWEVAELRELAVVIGSPPAAGSAPPAPSDPAPEPPPTPVPVPVPRSEC